MKRYAILVCAFVCAMLVLGGCMISTTKQARAAYCSPFDTTCNGELAATATSSSASVATTSTTVQTTGPVAVQPTVQSTAPVVVNQPPPPPRQRRLVSSEVVGNGFIRTTADTQAPGIMSVRLINQTPFYVCVTSSTFGSGEPALKPRAGYIEQDFLTRHRGWNIPCSSIILPALDGAPAQVEMAAAHTGTFSLTLAMYQYSTQPEYTGITQKRSFVFPNTTRTNPSCMFLGGCLHPWYIEASVTPTGPLDQMLAELRSKPFGGLVVKVLSDKLLIGDQG